MIELPNPGQRIWPERTDGTILRAAEELVGTRPVLPNPMRSLTGAEHTVLDGSGR